MVKFSKLSEANFLEKYEIIKMCDNVCITYYWVDRRQCIIIIIITDRQTQSQVAIGHTHSVSAATPWGL